VPNPHYQRVLEQDMALPTPVRWLSRAMSSWWTILVLGLLVVGYVAAAHVPLGGRYVWQWRMFDTTQHAVLTWWPLLVGAWLLTAVVLWAAMRRLPWRLDNLGAFVAVIGLATILLSQSWAFRSQTIGIAAVPVSASTGNAPADALSLNYTTRYGDTHDRVLVVMIGGAAPITIPIEGIPRWNDTTGDAMPTVRLHDDPRLAAAIGFGTRITTTAYLADGTLTENEDGTQTAEPTADGFRDLTTLPYPSNALLAMEITADLEDGSTQTTTAWLPFEPEGTDSLVPKHFFKIEGLGSVGIAFRPASKKLPFALGASVPLAPQKLFSASVHVADSDVDGRLLQPSHYDLRGKRSFQHRAIDEAGKPKQFTFEWVSKYQDKHANLTLSPHALIAVKSGVSNPFILAGLITFLVGVVLDRLLDWLGSRPKRKTTAPPKTEANGAAA